MKTNCPDCQRQQNCNPDIYNGKCKNMRNDNIRLAQHRLYRGFILPSITEATGETNGNYVHEFILKPEYIDRKTGRREMCKTILRNDYWCKGLGQTQPLSESYKKFKEIQKKRKNPESILQKNYDDKMIEQQKTLFNTERI